MTARSCPVTIFSLGNEAWRQCCCRGKGERSSYPFGASECKWMESVYKFTNDLYVEWKAWMSELICSFFDLAKLPTETKFNHVE